VTPCSLAVLEKHITFIFRVEVTSTQKTTVDIFTAVSTSVFVSQKHGDKRNVLRILGKQLEECELLEKKIMTSDETLIL
jgi:hypothetical protein